MQSTLYLWQEFGRFHLLAPDAPPISRDTRETILGEIQAVLARLRPVFVSEWVESLSRCGQLTWRQRIWFSPRQY